MATPGLQVIILAAGAGLRLGVTNNGRPKALLALAGRTLVERAIAFADGLGAARIVVVGGSGYAELARHVAALAHPRVKLVANPAFRDGNLYSLRAALAHVDARVLLTNVDHVYAASALATLAAAMGDGVTACCQFARPIAADEMKVELDDGGNLRRIAKTLARYSGAYIGLTHVAAAAHRDWIDAIERAAAANGDTAVAEHALQALADRGVPVRAARVDGIDWCEVDDPADHARADAMCASGVL